MKFQVKVKEGEAKFVKFYFKYIETDAVDGIVREYSFSSLVEDVTRTCDSF